MTTDPFHKWNSCDWRDAGLACHRLGIPSHAELNRSPFLGAIFEELVASLILNSQTDRGQRKELYHFRGQQGLQIDFLIRELRARFWLLEAKASKTVHPSMAAPIESLCARRQRPCASRLIVVDCKSHTGAGFTAIARGRDALNLEQFFNRNQPQQVLLNTAWVQISMLEFSNRLATIF